MRVLFLTLLDFSSLTERGIYTDLMREFVKEGHQVYIVSASEKREGQPVMVIEGDGYTILKVKIGNIQKTNVFEKGISTLLLDSQFKNGIREHFSGVKFDLLLYSTPPITLQKTISYIKKRDTCATYLLLKDIFPQNALDLGMLKKSGPRGVLYRYFRAREKNLYALSDYIGCMSPANVDFLLKNNAELSPEAVEVCPNSIEPEIIEWDEEKSRQVKMEYHIPLGKTVFIYGGNLGKPQGIRFLIDCLKANQGNDQAYFIIVGSGTEFFRLQTYIDDECPTNVKLFGQMSKGDYESLVKSCDVGMIFLDYRFTIPNFPSRILSYMQASIPVLAATDVSTDVGAVIEQGNFGLWCRSNDVDNFIRNVNRLCDSVYRKRMGLNARKYLEQYYSARSSYEVITSHFN